MVSLFKRLFQCGLGWMFLFLVTVWVEAQTVRVVAWNVEWFPGQQMHDVTPEMEVAHVSRAQAALKSMQADILLGSEIRNWKSFDALVSVVSGLQPVVVSAFRERDFGGLWLQQTAIATRLPVIAAWYEDWKPTIPSLSRGFSFAAIELPNAPGKVILTYAVHLKSNRSFNEAGAQLNFRLRNESVVQLLQHVAEMKRLTFQGRVAGVIVGGDFNTNHDGQFGDQVVKLMVDAGFQNTWEGVPPDKRYTWRGSEQFSPTTFDYIFTQGLEVSSAQLIDVPAEVSDHNAVLLEVTLPKEL